MTVTMKTTGVDSWAKKVQERVQWAKGGNGTTVVVGYEAPHATRVHEDLEMVHPNGGQAKFLEEPSRLYAREVQREVADTLARERDFEKALLAGGELLLELSEPYVPVDTGELVNSGTVRVVRQGLEDEESAR